MPPNRILYVLVTAVIVSVLASPAGSRTRQPPSPGGFECGSGGARNLRSLAFYHEYMERRGAALPRSSAAAAPYVYDGVWVVEDDGSLALAGSRPFDTKLWRFVYTPDGAGGYGVMFANPSFDPVFGTDLGLTDDDAAAVDLQFTFEFFGAGWTQLYVSANGAVSFGGDLAARASHEAVEFFNDYPKIAALFMDHHPAAGGAVYCKSEADRVTVTWHNVREYGTIRTNTFQLVLYNNHSFEIFYSDINTNYAVNGEPVITGIHPGGEPQLDPVDFSTETPYSGAPGGGFYEEYYYYTNPRVNEVALFRKFYETWADDYFQLVFFTNFTQSMGGFANHEIIRNDVTGIGRALLDRSALYGSAGTLESRCNMNDIAVWLNDPSAQMWSDGNTFLTIMAHESGHRWGIFVNYLDGGGPSNLILGRDNHHWSYYLDSDHSSLEGGNWDLVAPGTYRTLTRINDYGPLDKYFMGLYGAEDVPPTFYVSSPANNDSVARAEGTPPLGAQATGTPVPVDVQDIIAVEGLRTPLPPDEGKVLRQVFILLLLGGTTASQAELDKITGFRRAFEPYFENATDGRFALNNHVSQDFAHAAVLGRVTDRLTQQPVEDLLIESLERGFDQYVLRSGLYSFRYMADETSGPHEHVTIVFSAPGYYPDTVSADVSYGDQLLFDIRLDPVPSGSWAAGAAPYALYQNYPNPFNPATTIAYDISRDCHVTLEVFDVLGRRVRTLVSGPQSPGHKTVEWDGRDGAGQPVASGVYVYRIVAGDYTRQRKMLFLK
jgi:hypothetical protein